MIVLAFLVYRIKLLLKKKQYIVIIRTVYATHETITFLPTTFFYFFDLDIIFFILTFSSLFKLKIKAVLFLCVALCL